ncbi:hypothetical protein BDR05DRAFT_968820 [Suillus weaverae]|nr:hypothetical protein BDR05DRAFT_968820 [Suillus weaverae]
MPWSTRYEPVLVSFCAHDLLSSFDWYRSVFINSLLILWGFQLTLDPTKPLDTWGFMTGAMPNDRPCAIDFKTRFPEVELRHMMHNYPDIV